MNVQILRQLNKDFNGSVAHLLEMAASGERLCFYDKGITFAAGSSDDWAVNEDNRYKKYAWETETPNFYSMFGLAGLDYEFEVSEFDDGQADEASDVDGFMNAQVLKSNWVFAPVFIQAIPEMFLNLVQGGSRDPVFAGTFYHDLGIYWETIPGPLIIDTDVAAVALQLLITGEDSLPKHPQQPDAIGLPTCLFV
jgi:hypothetical protein